MNLLRIVIYCYSSFDLFSLRNLLNIQRLKFNLPYDLHLFHQGNIYWWMPLDRKLSVFGQGKPNLRHTGTS